MGGGGGWPYGCGMRRVLLAVGWVLGLYLLTRAVVEPFIIDMGDPATYRNDWGGPSLVGVLAVHCGPGLIAGVLMTRAVLRRQSRLREATSGGRDDQVVRYRP